MIKFLPYFAPRLAFIGLLSVAVFAVAPVAFWVPEAHAQAPMDGVKPLEKKAPVFKPNPKPKGGVAEKKGPPATPAANMEPITLQAPARDTVTLEDIRGKLIATPDVVSLSTNQLFVLDMIKKLNGDSNQ